MVRKYQLQFRLRARWINARTFDTKHEAEAYRATLVQTATRIRSYLAPKD